jgi:hypothetical protein
MYLHGARNLRVGQATSYEPGGSNAVSDEARARFLELAGVTLITGEYNRLWHRGSIDRMYEWLCQRRSSGTDNVVKRIFPNYAHQDLFWGRHAPDDVYPVIAERLRPPAADDVPPTQS